MARLRVMRCSMCDRETNISTEDLARQNIKTWIHVMSMHTEDDGDKLMFNGDCCSPECAIAYINITATSAEAAAVVHQEPFPYRGWEGRL